MTEAAVAAAMAVFNAEHSVAETLASIARQTRPPDEVVVVDDASTDRTAEVVSGWSDRLPLTLIRLERNVGCGAARAIAIQTARSDVIAPVDGDDVWLPDHLALNLPLVGPKTIAAVRQLRWSGGDLSAATPGWHEIPAPEDQASEILSKNFLFSGSLYWRSTLLDQAGGPSDRRTAEDRDTWIRLIGRAGCRAVPAPSPTVAYRMRPDSLSANEGSLDGVIELLEGFLADGTLRVSAESISLALRRSRARRRFLDALELADRGQVGAARRELLRAAVHDRSVRGGMATAEQGSVTLRSLVALVSPTRVAAQRRARMVKAGVALPEVAP